MDKHNINLNIHYTAPDEVWEKLALVYTEMPYWKGIINGDPVWKDDNGKLVEISVEPSGLQFYAEMPTEEWNLWIELFKTKASKLLGYEIGEPEDGYDFKYYQLNLINNKDINQKLEVNHEKMV